jgi:hypothetical protein
MSLMLRVPSIALLILSTSAGERRVWAQAGKPSLPPLNQKVLAFAKSHKNKQVGDGECWTLAREALVAAGARVPGVNGVDVLDFGQKLGPKERVLPGDIVQFKDARFEKRGLSWNMPHHTAIVLKKSAGKFILLNQNVGGKRKVIETDLSGMVLKAGEMTVWRPVELAAEEKK